MHTILARMLPLIIAFHISTLYAANPVFSLSNTTSHNQSPVLSTPHQSNHNAQLQRYYALQTAHALYRNQQESFRHYARLNQDELADEITNAINIMQQSGYGDTDIQRYMLSHHHLYGIPAFIAQVKQFHEYRQHIKALHAQITEYKRPAILYAINKRLNMLPLGFQNLDTQVQKLHREIIDQERSFTQHQIDRAYALLDEYDEDLFYQNDTRITRIEKRRDALQKTESQPTSLNGHRYTLSKNATTLLERHHINPNAFTTCTGTPIAQCIHQELVDIVHETERLHHTAAPKIYAAPLTAILELTDASCDFNTQGETVKAFAVTDLCWALLEGIKDGIQGAITDIAHHPVQAAACVIAGEYVLAYQLFKVAYNVAELGVLSLINPVEGSRKWHEYIDPIDQCITAIRNKEISLRDGIKGTTQLAVGYATQRKLLGSLGTLYSGAKTAALAYTKKNPLATPQQYMTTPEGLILKAVNDGDSIANASNPIRNAPKISKAIKASKKAAIKKAKLPTRGKLRYVPPNNWNPTEDLPIGRLPNGDSGYRDRFGNIWVRGNSRTAGEWREWDVQLSRQGIRQVGWMTRDNTHLNVSLKGRVTHK